MTYPFGAAKAELERSFALAAAESPTEPPHEPVPTAGREPFSESDWAVLLHELPEH